MASSSSTDVSIDPHTSVLNVKLIFQGTSQTVSMLLSTSGAELHQHAVRAFSLHPEEIDMESLKLLYKGKRISREENSFPFAPPSGVDNSSHKLQSLFNKPPKILIMASKQSSIQVLASKRSDPTIRGFEEEKLRDNRLKAQLQQQRSPLQWGEEMIQNKYYKFCRFQACTWQSFGHRSTDCTPHAFKAMQLMEKMATDPGIVAIMKERELVVGTLGEMDPIDDRIMQKTMQGGGCLLGYNTNGGARIDIKLRTDDLRSFRPYPDLIATLIHELSHNWVGEHNLLFWTNYAQMRAEYLYTHATLRSTLVRGKTTAELAGLDKSRLDNVMDYIMHELVGEMHNHGLNPQAIEAPIRQRIRELEAGIQRGQQLGSSGAVTAGSSGNKRVSAKELALEAAERRATEQRKKQDA